VKAIVRKAGDGDVYGRPSTGGSVTVKVSGPAATVFETQRAAGNAGGPGKHSHPGFDETFYVVSGRWEFTAGDERFVAEAGTVIHLPRGIFHSFRSTGEVSGKLVGIAVPGGIEEFFAEAERTANDHEAGAGHGIEFASID
jgi:mannose-6-phosphate isomerase-like protein (cupin superfamily)